MSRTVKNRGPEAGFTIIEIMISLGILAFVVASFAQAFLAQDKVYKITEQTVALQGDVRAVVEQMTNDINEAGGGFSGMFSYKKNGTACDQLYGLRVDKGSPQLCANEKYSNGVWPFAGTIKDVNNVTINCSGLFLAGTDAANTVLLSEETRSDPGEGSAQTTFTFKHVCRTSGVALFKVNDYVVVSNYTHANLFKVTGSSASGTACTVTALDVLGYDAVSVAGKNESGTDTTYYMTYKYEAFKSFMSLYRNNIYFYCANNNLYKTDSFQTNTGYQPVRFGEINMSWEIGYSTPAASYPYYKHEVDTYAIKPDQCAVTTYDTYRPTAVKVNVVAQSDAEVTSDVNNMAPSEAYMPTSLGYTLEVQGASGTATSLSATPTKYAYRMASVLQDLKNAYGMDYGEHNDYLASQICK